MSSARIVIVEVETRILGGLARRIDHAAWVWVAATRQWEPVGQEVRYSL